MRIVICRRAGRVLNFGSSCFGSFMIYSCFGLGAFGIVGFIKTVTLKYDSTGSNNFMQSPGMAMRTFYPRFIISVLQKLAGLLALTAAI